MKNIKKFLLFIVVLFLLIPCICKIFSSLKHQRNKIFSFDGFYDINGFRIDIRKVIHAPGEM